MLLQKIIIGLFLMILIAGGLAVSGCSIETHNNVSTGEGSAGDTDTSDDGDDDNSTDDGDDDNSTDDGDDDNSTDDGDDGNTADDGDDDNSTN